MFPLSSNLGASTCWKTQALSRDCSTLQSNKAGSVVLRTPHWTHYLLTGSDILPATTAQYQHVAITLRSRQLLKMGTWLPETCWATCKGEIKENTKLTSSWFLIHTEEQSCIVLQRILCITRTVKHNYILPISTVRIQLHVSALYVDHLQVEIF